MLLCNNINTESTNIYAPININILHSIQYLYLKINQYSKAGTEEHHKLWIVDDDDNLIFFIKKNGKETHVSSVLSFTSIMEEY